MDICSSHDLPICIYDNREGKAVNKETIGNEAKKRIRPPSELTNIALFASSQASTVIRKQRKTEVFVDFLSVNNRKLMPPTFSPMGWEKENWTDWSPIIRVIDIHAPLRI